MNWIAIVSASIFVVLGIMIFFYFGVAELKWYGFLFGTILFFVGGTGLGVFTQNCAYYLPAEPLAYNQTQTIFTTNKGTYTVNGLYPDGTYMLTVDGDNVLVVWQAVDGVEG